MRHDGMNLLLSTLLTAATLPWAAAMPADLAEAPPVADFSLQLLQQVAANVPGNVCLSPWSAGSSLALLQSGAEGDTRRRMDAVLGTPDRWERALRHAELPITAADRVVVETSLPLKAEYVASLPKGSIARADFAGEPERARLEINAWAADKTDDMIRDLLPPGSIDAQTRLVAVNAVLFHGRWASPFPKGATRPAPFHLSDGGEVEVPMMSHAASFRYVEADGCRAVALPYTSASEGVGPRKEGNAYFIAVLPNEGTALRPWLQQLTPERLARIRNQLADPSSKKQIRLSLPRFCMETPALSLNDALSRLGMQVAFSDEADFSGITSTRAPLYLSDVFQKCVVKVNEAGTEAAAATAGILATRSMPRYQGEFIADRPFLWQIASLDPSSPAFFTGLVEKPEQEPRP